ncbi:MAG: flagellar M-ring protein FliF [Alphaproteobacteria bacterium]|nr:flagellar M-ring protein FliF [Alphaproteobacteria bacterium]
MQGLVSVWRIMTPAKRVMLIGAVAATIALFSILARTASTPNMSLLFAGLDGRTSGEVVAALARLNIPYDIRGDAIYVPSAKRDAVRMQLAGEGLPEQGQAGYELLDKLNGFATTSDMFDATYWRAKEGELARTILATPGVRAARVHIAAPKEGAFSRNAPPTTGAVTVTMGASPLEPNQAKAIRYLVSSAVPGLKPEEVAVIDSARGVVLSPGSDTDELGVGGDADARAAKMEKNILDLLEARVGPGNARVKVALDLDMERQAVTEHTYNPDGRVMSGKETTEVTESSNGGGGGGPVTVASNLPEGDAGASGGASNSQRTETRETIKYDMSDVKRETEKLPGSIKRMSIAVFVNQIAQPAAEDGGQPVMRTPEELDTLKKLVADAAGLDPKRGDSITIEALPFRTSSTEGVLVKANPMGDFLRAHLMDAIKIGILALVTLILGLFVVKPLFSTKGEAGAAALPAAAPSPAAAPAEGGAIAVQPAYAEIAPPAQEPDAIEALKQIAASNTDETANLIKSWLETAEDAA